jgi:hypothetical protein
MKARLALLVLSATGSAALAQVNPGGKLVETKDGIVFQRNTPTPRPTHAKAERSPDGGGAPPTVAPPAGPAGPSVVNAAFVTFRGTVVRIEKGTAITILDARTGKERRVLLAKAAAVPEKLRQGDAISLRVPLEDGAGALAADRVEFQKTPAAADSKSKFGPAPPPAVR